MIWTEFAPLDALRILCGLFLIPHIAAKLADRQPSIALFEKAGLRPARPFVILAIIVEAVAAIGLVIGILVPIAATLAALFLSVAGVVILRVTGGGWRWNLGGAEYCFFWALACAIVAIG